MPRRIALRVSYDGTGFHGSQVQPGKRTVAGTLTSELETLNQAPLKLEFASRTDAGVHANGNVCAFDTESKLPPQAFVERLNHRLPSDLRVREGWEAPAAFNPRFHARERHYIYRLHLGETVPVEHWRCWAQYADVWDSERVQAALQVLSGEHFYHCFAARTLEREHSRCRIAGSMKDEGAGSVELIFVGDRFLYNLICRLVGALLLCSAGKIGTAEIEAALAGEMSFQLKPAPPKGLVLENVHYRQEAYLNE